MSDLGGLLRCLVEAGAEFIVVGGVAATAHGSSRLTQDVDVVYRRSRDNHERLVRALEGLDPYLRGAPPGLPFHWDVATIEAGLNFTLSTSLGALDFFGEIAGGGTYEALRPHTITLEAFGIECACLDLPTLVRVKRAAGRPRDFDAIAELEAMLDDSANDDG